MITYICNNNIRNFWIYLKGYFKANNGKKIKMKLQLNIYIGRNYIINHWR